MSRGALPWFWLPAGVRDLRLLFPDSCHVRGERPAGQGPGGAPAAQRRTGGRFRQRERERSGKKEHFAVAELLSKDADAAPN